VRGSQETKERCERHIKAAIKELANDDEGKSIMTNDDERGGGGV